ncbi:GNAT family N-acetyltransferase [Rhodococcus sp. O3]|uniref:GNAT family N-acetyltransferase n=1 Tax=Rhodococcus sp. O3 TaxID=3404919 RepID=UPI003B68490B
MTTGTSTIAALDPADPGFPADVRAVTGIVNAVYVVAEDGMWPAGATRTDTDEVAAAARRGEMFVARTAAGIVGSIRIVRIDESTAEFGMLAADFAARGLGVGRALVRFAEEHCAAAGFRYLQLEVIRPRDQDIESKQFLAQWYPRMGYAVVGTVPAEVGHPELAPLLAVPCEVVTHRKTLTGPPSA